MGEKGFWARIRPYDRGNNGQLTDMAKKLYQQIYHSLAMSVFSMPSVHATSTNLSPNRGNMQVIKRFCLPPLARDFQHRINARGSLKMNWELLGFNGVSVVSHRAQPLGEDQLPDTAYRQAIIRIKSTQRLTLTGEDSASSASASSSLTSPSTVKGRWYPDELKEKLKNAKPEKQKMTTMETRMDGYLDSGKTKEVVEYLVLQKRVIRGKEEDWKVWGFTQESTPVRVEEDAKYWRKTLDAQVAASG